MATCIPVASGVPGLSGAPQWWNPAGAPRPYDDDVNDPRWRGATRRGYQNGASEDGVFRALHMIESGNPVLYLSFQAFHDPTQGTNLDGIYVGFQRSGGPAFLINIQAYSSVATSFEAGSTAGTACFPLSGTAAGPPIANPLWLNDTRAWLTLPSGGSTSYSWAINMRVPTKSSGDDFDDAGINLGSLSGGATFKFFYAIVKDIGSAVVAYYLPRTVDIDINPATLDNVYPDPSTWDDARIGGGAGCGTGISLSAWDVGTTNTDPVSGLPTPNEIHVNAAAPTTNGLFAKPLNATGGDVTPNSLEATFRTANWGSQADFTFAAGATPWEEILPGTTKDNGAATTTNGNKASIEFDWTISAAEAADWIPPGGSKWTHQCLLVTLQGPYDFINDSVYRNMDFVQASEFERDAEISVQGLEPVAGSRREVYLYVEKNNMPDEADGKPPPDIRRIMSQLAESADLGAARLMAVRPAQSVVPTFDLLAAYVPTIRFHVFHETTKRINIGGKVKPIVEEQTAFGHFVHHEGDVYGWDHTLGGEFKKVSENLYRLEVPEGWKSVIRTRVRAWEEKPPDDRGPEIVPGPPQPPRPKEDGEKPTPGGCLKQLTRGASAMAALAAIVHWARR